MKATQFDPVTKVFSGPDHTFDIAKCKNFGEILLEKLNGSDRERVSQIDGDTGETMTKLTIRKRTVACAQNLTKLGCTTNDCIGIIARNSSNLTPLIFGALCIGAPVSPLDVILVKDDISKILQRVRPSFIFCDSDVFKSIKEILDDIELKAKLFTVRGTVDGVDTLDSLMVETGEEDSFECTKIEEPQKHIAWIACSSGSTGLPKSICLSHALFNYTFSHRNEEYPFVALSFSSLFWFSGVWASITAAFTCTRIFTSKPFSTDLFFDLVEKYKIQFFIGPNCQVQAFLKSERCKSADISSLYVCYAIGGHIPSILVHTMKQILPKCVLLTAYGMTEIGGGACYTNPRELEDHPNSVGQLLPGVHMKIISETTGERCGAGEAGEIFVKTLIPPMGYYRDEVATKSSFDAEGYFITGDIGCFGEDGRLSIIGRKKEIFKNCGFAVWPAEIENIMLKNPAVREVAVVSVYDEAIMSELPAALVVKKESISEEKLYSLVADQLASYKRLDGGIYFVDEMPMTPSGKIFRPKVKQLAQHFYEKQKL